MKWVREGSRIILALMAWTVFAVMMYGLLFSDGDKRGVDGCAASMDVQRRPTCASPHMYHRRRTGND